ncbi:Ubiquinone/menaquinone biosynthesis C-methylase UbiE [Raineyella antarctica]|uniref:Ubiquinone/menaquinone biosynthesis C-methylase UbiE n=1 Tax=Raineyella antarctica TaxID=1577474 RepID=A0A1G6IL19_9ACTN|nr:class I SAM-dependent methyltransferase [Raineyella antarctica]SDC07143.1 Ubiquinone/menaquinone biosynthesis C-methylase UbiE [Raineyella antarctica]
MTLADRARAALPAASLGDWFDAGAPRYDLMVGLNPGYHAALDRSARTLAHRARPAEDRPLRILDLACGSGASTAALARALPAGTVLQGLDASAGMLAAAHRKRWPASVSFGQAVCGELDLDTLGRGSWDGIHAAYLFRNVPAERRDTAVREVHELLAPGGWLVTQEYSVAGDRRAAATWEAVSRGIISPLAAVLDRGNTGLYRYLRSSVREFDSTDRFCGRLAGAGFADVGHQDVRGWQRGILHTFHAHKEPLG